MSTDIGTGRCIIPSTNTFQTHVQSSDFYRRREDTIFVDLSLKFLIVIPTYTYLQRKQFPPPPSGIFGTTMPRWPHSFKRAASPPHQTDTRRAHHCALCNGLFTLRWFSRQLDLGPPTGKTQDRQRMWTALSHLSARRAAVVIWRGEEPTVWGDCDGCSFAVPPS